MGTSARATIMTAFTKKAIADMSQHQDRADAASTSASDAAGRRSTALPWLFILVGAVIALVAAIDLAAELNFSFRGHAERGTIVSTEGGAGRVRTVTARVHVQPQATAPFDVEIRDTFGTHGWKEGDGVDLRCARIHEDHLNCVADRWSDRYPLTLIALAIGVAIVWGALASRRGRDVQAA